MSTEHFIRRINLLKQEKKSLEKLLQSTEEEVLKIMKKNSEESWRVKQLLESALPLSNESSRKKPGGMIENSSQTENSLATLYHAIALEEEIITVKETLINIATNHRMMKNKLERRKKKNKVFEDLIKQYQERVESLNREKVNLRNKIEEKREEQGAMIEYVRYGDLIVDPVPCVFKIQNE
ncbi:unnamed protein product [Blepharisma stoltei]|uniref:Uncharacterized protein n=1 Tax=Blepharisma stoltei TaxID=1481888 RepID=A0AAU9IVR8_9CILI|nr:unnamed protein product [Blepharisma stoltei]